MRKRYFMENYKNIIRLSNLLLDAICELKRQRLWDIRDKFKDFAGKCSELINDSHLLYAAVERNWFKSVETISTRTDRNLDDLSYSLKKFQEIINIDEPKVPRLSDIISELSQLEQELGEYQFSLKDKTISVITEPITLEDVSLGPFEIRLLIDRIGSLYSDAPYKIIALEPNPAGSDDSITHPHVSSEKLCEGDGHTAIRCAIEQGRFCDFFTLVTGVLKTYNSDSPYIRLDDWEGSSCYDCGCTISGDEGYYCEYCDHEFCEQCSSCCEKCGNTICLGCAYQCPSCEEPVCINCTAKCKDCGELYCKDCLTKQGLCHDCVKQRKEEKNEQQEDISEKSETITAVQSDSMGKTDIHA